MSHFAADVPTMVAKYRTTVKCMCGARITALQLMAVHVMQGLHWHMPYR